MGKFDLWFDHDVRRLLDGLSRAAARYEDGEYRSAYLDAVSDVASLFGVEVQAETGIVSVATDGRSQLCQK